MNVYTAADLDDLARLREEVERLKWQLDQSEMDAFMLAREAAGLLEILRASHEGYKQGTGPCLCQAHEMTRAFLAAHPELTE